MKLDVKKIADESDMIINGYAFKRNGNFIQVLNLNAPKRAVVLSQNGEMVETSMDDIENSIVIDYYEQKVKYIILNRQPG